MKIDLEKYLAERHRIKDVTENPGPVITISREFGCGAIPIASKLAEALSEKGNSLATKTPWRHVSKEILEQSAREMHMNPSKIEYVFSPHEKNVVKEMFDSFSIKKQLNDPKIHQTVKQVITSISESGHVIILGMGAVSIAKNIKQSLHVKLIAPLEWRVRKVSNEHKINVEKAKELILRNDQYRVLCIEQLRGERYSFNFFDIILNVAQFAEPEIIDIIKRATEVKNLAY